MPDEIRVSRPQQSVSGMQPAMRQDMQMQGEMSQQQGRGGSKMPWIILGLIVIVLVVLGVLFRDKLFKGSSSANKMTATTTGKPSGYQAVFLSNGQVYFGKISSDEGNYVTLQDIYYLQVVQPPLQGNQQGTATGQPAAAAAQPQISLVKLGNELHGPVDEMHISRAQILFYEDLKADGSVVKAIDAYKTNPTGTPAPTPAP